MKTNLSIALQCGMLFLAVAIGPATARENAFLSLPDSSTRPLGFSVVIQASDVRFFGDFPFQVRVTPTGNVFPTTRNLMLRVSCEARTTQPPGRDLIYELPIELRQDEKLAEATFFLPKWSVGGDLVIQIIENRNVLPGYGGRLVQLNADVANAEELWMQSAAMRFRWVIENADDKPPTAVLMAMVAPELLSINSLRTKPGPEFGDLLPQFQFVARDEIAADWRTFDSSDVWCIEPETLDNLLRQNAAVAQSLRNYLLCGGTLWVIGDVPETRLTTWLAYPDENKEQREKHFESAMKSLKDMRQFSFGRYEDFRITNSNSYNVAPAKIRNLVVQRSGGFNNSQTNTASLDATFDDNIVYLNELEVSASSLDEDSFSYYPLGLGRVVVCKSPDPLPGKGNQWLAMGVLTGAGVSESNRRSVDPSFGDRRYWDWIIPDVAQPPIYTFIGLLTVFTIVVGPVSYRKFTRLGRGYLMMFIAPLLAVLTTLLMFAYGLIADGVSTRARVREITYIGDKDGNAARYSRATYFTGVAPVDGLTFPADAVVLPYQLSTDESWYEASNREHSVIGTIRFTDDVMQMDRGFLPSRQQKQFITYRPVEQVGTLRFSDGGTTNVRNDTKIDLRDGIIVDKAGKCFAFDLLVGGTTGDVKEITNVEASERLSSLYTLQRPIAPAGVSTTRRQGEYMIDMVGAMQNRDPRRQIGAAFSSNGESQIESWLRTTLQIQSVIPPGSFMAIADVTTDCIAVPGTRLDESIHYVYGVMP